MKNLCLAAILFNFLSTNSFAKDSELVVYTYSSLTGKGSLTELLKKEWEAKGKKVKFVAFSTSSESLNQVMLEKNNTQADLVLGIDQLGIKKAESSKLFLSEDYSSFTNQLVSEVPKELLQKGFVPFDYGYLAFVYDSRKIKGPHPSNFSEFLRQTEGKKNVILIDPRTSQLGLSFLSWTKLIWEGETWKKNMSSLIKSVRIWASGWSAAYALFQKGEGDYVLSYTTSPAYHIEEEKVEHFKTLSFEEGHFQQVETAAVVKTSKNQKLAKEFLKILLSKRIQDKIAKLQWMYPVVKNAELPQSFSKLLKAKPLTGSMFIEESALKLCLNSWNDLILSQK